MYKVVQLYGGAARCEVPSDWIDASTLRDVPNNQEVFVDESGSTSVIIEILEFQAAVNDVEAGRFFFNDMAHADGAVSIQINEPGYKLGEADFLGTRAVTCSVQGIQVKGKSGPSAMAAPVAVHMTVIRSKTFEADVLVTTHAPPTESGATELHEHIVNSILFLDPTLFG